MKVFLSWSGLLSHRVALVLRDWLPSVVQAVRPYVSSEDIDKGTRWSTDIAQELEESTFGIICITQENVDAPWINFEAGALSKTIDKSYVSPFLFGIKRSEIQGPLLQFQSTVYEKPDVKKLLNSINDRLPEADRLTEMQLQKSFDVWWPELEKQLNALPKQTRSGQNKKEQSAGSEERASKILEEILELARNQQRLLRSPEDLLPPDYLRKAIGTKGESPLPRLQMEIEEIESRALELRFRFSRAAVAEDTDPAFKEFYEAFVVLAVQIHALFNLVTILRRGA